MTIECMWNKCLTNKPKQCLTHNQPLSKCLKITLDFKDPLSESFADQNIHGILVLKEIIRKNSQKMNFTDYEIGVINETLLRLTSAIKENSIDDHGRNIISFIINQLVKKGEKLQEIIYAVKDEDKKLPN